MTHEMRGPNALSQRSSNVISKPMFKSMSFQYRRVRKATTWSSSPSFTRCPWRLLPLQNDATSRSLESGIALSASDTIVSSACEFALAYIFLAILVLVTVFDKQTETCNSLPIPSKMKLLCQRQCRHLNL
jgi:hypothetical protein